MSEQLTLAQRMITPETIIERLTEDSYRKEYHKPFNTWANISQAQLEEHLSDYQKTLKILEQDKNAIEGHEETLYKIEIVSGLITDLTQEEF